MRVSLWVPNPVYDFGFGISWLTKGIAKVSYVSLVFILKLTCWWLPLSLFSAVLGVFAMPTVGRKIIPKLWSGVWIVFGLVVLISSFFISFPISHENPKTIFECFLLPHISSVSVVVLDFLKPYPVLHYLPWLILFANLVSAFVELGRWQRNKLDKLESEKEKLENQGQISEVKSEPKLETPKSENIPNDLELLHPKWKLEHDPMIDQIDFTGKKFEFKSAIKPDDNNQRIDGKTLRTRLSDELALGERGLRYLQQNQHLIPKELQGQKHIVGSTVWFGDDYLLVPVLDWNGVEWCPYFLYLDSDWLSNYCFVRVCA